MEAMRTESAQRDQTRLSVFDTLRGLAVLAMVMFHALFLVEFWFTVPLGLRSSLWFPFLGASSATLFFLISGAVAQVSFTRWRQSGKGAAWIAARFARRSARIWLIGLGITLGSFLVAPTSGILFGTLQFLALANMLLFPLLFLSEKIWPPLAVAGVLLGFWAKRHTGSLFLIPIGLTPADFQSLDYYPLFPWFAAVLCGAWLGPRLKNIRYHQRLLQTMGKHSLPIYLFHVPLLWLLLSMLLRKF